MDLGSSKRYRRQITSLLTDLDKANHTSYEQQIEASAERIATATGERMRGLIRSGIISPVTGAVVTYAANEMFDWVNTELFGRRELDKLKAMADSLQLGGGVSAGENYGSDGKQELDKTFLSYRADDIIEFIEKYQNFAKEYPTLAEYGLQALSLGLKGVYTLATGGTGLFAIAANEAKGMLVSAVTADAMQKVVDISIEKTQKQLLEYDSTLTDQQAQALASALVVGTALTFSSVQDVRSYASVIKNIGKPKVTNANPLHLEAEKTEPLSGRRVAETNEIKEGTARITAPLLPNEGKVGSYSHLKRLEKPGDNLTPHHIPSAEYMKQFDIKNAEGISIMVEQPYPGVGGRHRKTQTYGRKPNLEQNPRTELAKDILDLRGIYKEDGVYTPEIRESLQEVVKQNKEKFPTIFDKNNKK